MIHGCKLNKNEECDICMEELLHNDELDLNSILNFDDLDEEGEEFEY